MNDDNPMLKKLLERQNKLASEIKKAKAAQSKKAAIAYADKCRIVGAAILSECETNETLAATINPLVEQRTTNAKDRKTYGLEPLPKNTRTNTNDQAKPSTSLNDKTTQTNG